MASSTSFTAFPLHWFRIVTLAHPSAPSSILATTPTTCGSYALNLLRSVPGVVGAAFGRARILARPPIASGVDGFTCVE
ncbi:hypothetical protein K466DRAFT_591767 [Polyporus arcularius HHB13444]|uniref:Secreted protein n=1 Tax=Polyporus arcularius HHB13444 TaxID=1314778 RepID=A0A5C3NX12_9APHY|nr:hypothetical protein K466DRAFT_591767 [Polyporus arcularius HHB13444]